MDHWIQLEDHHIQEDSYVLEDNIIQLEDSRVQLVDHWVQLEDHPIKLEDSCVLEGNRVQLLLRNNKIFWFFILTQLTNEPSTKIINNPNVFSLMYTGNTSPEEAVLPQTRLCQSNERLGDTRPAVRRLVIILWWCWTGDVKALFLQDTIFGRLSKPLKVTSSQAAGLKKQQEITDWCSHEKANSGLWLLEIESYKEPERT